MGSEEVMGIQWVKGRGTSAEGQGLHKPWGGQQGGEGGRGRGFALHGRGVHWDLGRVPNRYDGGTWSWGALPLGSRPPTQRRITGQRRLGEVRFVESAFWRETGRGKAGRSPAQRGRRGEKAAGSRRGAAATRRRGGRFTGGPRWAVLGDPAARPPRLTAGCRIALCPPRMRSPRIWVL